MPRLFLFVLYGQHLEYDVAHFRHWLNLAFAYLSPMFSSLYLPFQSIFYPSIFSWHTNLFKPQWPCTFYSFCLDALGLPLPLCHFCLVNSFQDSAQIAVPPTLPPNHRHLFITPNSTKHLTHCAITIYLSVSSTRPRAAWRQRPNLNYLLCIPRAHHSARYTEELKCLSSGIIVGYEMETMLSS